MLLTLIEREYRNYKATLQDKEREMEAIRKTNDELRGKVNVSVGVLFLAYYG